MRASSDAADAAWLQRHAQRLCASYLRLTGRHLVDPGAGDPVKALDGASFAVVSHGTEADPVFNYANRAALALFATDWTSFTRLPSRCSAEAAQQEAREKLLAQVAQQGFADDYCGIRIAADGRRFRIEDTTVWNVLDEDGRSVGQAARIPRWVPLAPGTAA